MRPMPPIIAATCWPGRRSLSGAASTMPTASIPSTRGKVTPSARPRRECSSERFQPNALSAIRTQPGPGSGTGKSLISRFSSGPGSRNTTARIVFAISISSTQKALLGFVAARSTFYTINVIKIGYTTRRFHHTRLLEERAMYDPQSSPPTAPLASPEPPRRRHILLWVIGALGVLVLLQVAVLGAVLAVPGLRNQTKPFWIKPSAAPPPESPLPANLPALARPLKIDETWDQPTARWEQSLARVVDGAYEMRVDNPNYDSYGLLSSEKPIRDFDIAVDMQQVAGDPTAEYGVRFRQTGPSDYLMFSISGSGYYRLLRVKSGVYSSLTPWTFDGRIKTGANAVNRLHVVAQGSSIAGSINDLQLISAKDEIDTGGQLTFGVTTF